MARITVNLDEFGYLRCPTCGLPYARLSGNVLIIESRHHGEKHTNTITVDKLAELVERPVRQTNDALGESNALGNCKERG